MAEIHVQAKKKSPMLWVWIVAAVIIIAAVVFFLARNKKTANNTVSKPNPTTYVQPERNDVIVS
jgi:lipopolysaccharide export system protein LptC